MRDGAPSTADGAPGPGQTRLAIYCDYPYRIADGRLFADQPVALFLAGLSAYAGPLTMIGRLDETGGRFPYELEGVAFAALPHYASGADPWSLVRSVPVSMAAFWKALGAVDAIWVFGPTPLSLVFSVLALARRRRLVLGIRQDTLEFYAHRYPDRPLVQAVARILEGASRLLARRVPVVVVGPQLAAHYRRARRLHVAYMSLLSEHEIAETAPDRPDVDGPELRMLSVGRLDPEKNPLLLADILAGAVAADPRWRMDICGEGPLREALEDRLRELGVADRATLHGHVPVNGGLLDLYDRSHVLLHVSHTEGVPQVLLEAFARRLPVIATAVGGVPYLVEGCGLLVAPRDAPAAVRALAEMIGDPDLRARLVRNGLARLREHTREAEGARLGAFLRRVRA
jgi:glycosyltransferase involved in cell wall biosynthesis